MMGSRLATVALLVWIAPQAARAQMALKVGEEKTGLTKQCYYRFGSSTYARTVKSYELCPLSIELGAAGGSSATRGGGNALTALVQGLADRNAPSDNTETKVQELQDLIAQQQAELVALRRELAALRAEQQPPRAAGPDRRSQPVFRRYTDPAGFLRDATCGYLLDGKPVPETVPTIKILDLAKLKMWCTLLRAGGREKLLGVDDPSLKDIRDLIDAILSQVRLP